METKGNQLVLDIQKDQRDRMIGSICRRALKLKTMGGPELTEAEQRLINKIDNTSMNPDGLVLSPAEVALVIEGIKWNTDFEKRINGVLYADDDLADRARPDLQAFIDAQTPRDIAPAE